MQAKILALDSQLMKLPSPGAKRLCIRHSRFGWLRCKRVHEEEGPAQPDAIPAHFQTLIEQVSANADENGTFRRATAEIQVRTILAYEKTGEIYSLTGEAIRKATIGLRNATLVLAIASIVLGIITAWTK